MDSLLLELEHLPGGGPVYLPVEEAASSFSPYKYHKPPSTFSLSSDGTKCIEASPHRIVRSNDLSFLPFKQLQLGNELEMLRWLGKERKEAEEFGAERDGSSLISSGMAEAEHTWLSAHLATIETLIRVNLARIVTAERLADAFWYASEFEG
ncbi:unnamed protein product [Protopolystoma xenopodis]|uniref:Uncharacterized protein n=1 Tax=Protopolystoma xenopodis TaxID=117903 RepID=A0A3S5BKP3_9PLAT|nr:unnamed protein product [Protopolystoma xenopodis]